jgi:hypothetical protein
MEMASKITLPLKIRIYKAILELFCKGIKVVNNAPPYEGIMEDQRYGSTRF